MATVWRLMAHWEQPEKVAQWMKKEGRISIGWCHEIDLSNHQTPDEIGKTILQTWPESHNWMYGKKQLWNFIHEAKIGDLVIVSSGKRREYVAKIVGEYKHSEDKTYNVGHHRATTLTNIDPDKLWASAGKAAPGQGIRWTFIRCALPVEV